MDCEFQTKENLISEETRIELEKFDPALSRKVENLELMGVKINCHGAAAYLSGLSFDTPKGISPEDMYHQVSYLEKTKAPAKGDVALVFIDNLVAHSGLVIENKNGEPILLHKGGYNEPFKIEPAHSAFKGNTVEYRKVK